MSWSTDLEPKFIKGIFLGHSLKAQDFDKIQRKKFSLQFGPYTPLNLPHHDSDFSKDVCDGLESKCCNTRGLK